MWPNSHNGKLNFLCSGLRDVPKTVLPKSIEKFLEEYMQRINSFDKLFSRKGNLIKMW